MGGGASRHKRNSKKPGASGIPLELGAAARRRRKVLFGDGAPPKFESVTASEQFDLDRYPEDEDDPVFGRFDDWQDVNKLRNDLGVKKTADDLLKENAIDTLGIGITGQHKLGQKLFKVALVEKPKPTGPGAQDDFGEGPPKDKIQFEQRKSLQKQMLDCYEMMALFSVVRHGSVDQLLELVFCVFDADGDDRVGIDDFKETVLDYLDALDLTGIGALEGTDLEEFRSMGENDRYAAAKRLAEDVMAKYGSASEEPSPEDETPGPDPAMDVAASQSPSDATSGAGSGEQPKPKPKKKAGSRCCLCSGKPPASDTEDAGAKAEKGKKEGKEPDDSDSDSPYPSDEDDGAQKKIQKQASKRSNLSRKSQEKKEELAGKADDAKQKAEAKAKAKAKAKIAAAKKPSGKSTGCFPCRRSSSSPEKLPPPLTFDQWKRWFMEFCEIPAGPGLDAETAMVKSSQPVGRDVGMAGQIAQAPTHTMPPGGLANLANKPWGQQAGGNPYSSFGSGQVSRMARGQFNVGEDDEFEELEAESSYAAQLRQPLRTGVAS